MTRTLELDAPHAAAAAERAGRLGLSVGDYLARLIDRDAGGADVFHEVTRPLADALAGADEGELDELVDEARTASHAARRREAGW